MAADKKKEVEKFSAAHDVGQVINEDSVRGQIEGGIIQGLGHAIFDATGVRVTKILMKPDQVYLALKEAKYGKRCESKC